MTGSVETKTVDKGIAMRNPIFRTKSIYERMEIGDSIRYPAAGPACDAAKRANAKYKEKKFEAGEDANGHIRVWRSA